MPSKKQRSKEKKRQAQLIMSKHITHNEPMNVWAKSINERFRYYVIKTTHKEVVGVMKMITEEQESVSDKWEPKKYDKKVLQKEDILGLQRDRMNKILKNIEKYNDEELNNLYEKKNKLWTDWCNDVILYYCYNNKLNDVCIPLVGL
jgi:hypothetical protein